MPCSRKRWPATSTVAPSMTRGVPSTCARTGAVRARERERQSHRAQRRFDHARCPSLPTADPARLSGAPASGQARSGPAGVATPSFEPLPSSGSTTRAKPEVPGDMNCIDWLLAMDLLSASRQRRALPRWPPQGGLRVSGSDGHGRDPLLSRRRPVNSGRYHEGSRARTPPPASPQAVTTRAIRRIARLLPAECAKSTGERQAPEPPIEADLAQPSRPTALRRICRQPHFWLGSKARYRAACSGQVYYAFPHGRLISITSTPVPATSPWNPKISAVFALTPKPAVTEHFPFGTPTRPTNKYDPVDAASPVRTHENLCSRNPVATIVGLSVVYATVFL